MSNVENDKKTVKVWSVVIGEKIGGEEPHTDYAIALQSLIIQAESYLQEMQTNPQLEPRSIRLLCEHIPAEEWDE